MYTMTYINTLFVAAALLITSTYAEDPWTPSPLCPFPSEDLTRFPFEGDCSKYWECFEGARYPMDCPAGLEFNAAESRCDTPSLANCDPDATIIYPTFSHSTHTTPSRAPTPDPGERPECPFPSDELTFFPVTNNCSQYWECFQGNRYLMTCPSGLHWNTLYNYCDYPGNVNCDRENVTTTPSPATTPGSNSTSTPNTDSPVTPDPQCPYPSDELTFFPHPTDCSKYYECYQGNKFLMSCQTGLVWNNDAKTCDYKENVNCDRVSTTVSPNSPTPTPTSPNTGSTVTTVPTPTSTSNSICAGLADGTYLPNPDNCHRFYECVGGKAVEGQCAGDLVWHEEILSCDYPENVSCNHLLNI